MTEHKYEGQLNMVTRNGYVEIIRIILTAAICLHHFRMYSLALPYGGGYLAADCFFIISGFYLAGWIKKNVADTPAVGKYLISRVKKLAPDHLIALAFSFLILHFAFKRAIDGSILGYIMEVLMLPFFNNPGEKRIIPPDWFVGYLLFTSVLVILLFWLFRNKRILTVLAFTAISAISLFYMIRIRSGLCIYPSESSFFSLETLCRSFFDMSIGIMLYHVGKSNIFDRLRKNVIVKVLIVVASAAELYLLFWYSGWQYPDYAAVALFAFIFLFSSAQNGFALGDKAERLILSASSKCFIIYLNHYVIVYVFWYYHFGGELDWKLISVIYLFSVMIYGAIIWFIKKIIESLIARPV